MSRRHYPKLEHAPIVEAVVDIDCVFESPFDPRAAESKALDLFSDRYPTIGWRNKAEVTMQLLPTADTSFSASQTMEALQLRQLDDCQLIQLRVGGYSFNRLQPYSTFDDYRDEIIRTWNLYCQIAGPKLIQRVGLRYLNSIRLPMKDGRLDFDDYLKTGPRTPNDKVYSVGPFSLQTVLRSAESECWAICNLISQGVEDEQVIVLLDISTHIQTRLAPSDSISIMARLDELRDLKNNIFHESLTETCLTLYR